MSGELVTMDAGEARVVTDQIKTGVEAVWHLITRAYTERAWTALGYQSWDDYCTREFGTSRLRLPREERPEVVSSLRDSGLSIRAIAAATGDSYGTIQAEVIKNDHLSDGSAVSDALAEELIATPAERTTITGIDGKDYPATSTPKEPRRKALTDSAREIGLDLGRLIDRIERFAADDRLGRNKNEVGPHLRHHLVRAAQVCTDLNNTLNK